MNEIKETGEQARQGEISRKTPVLRVLIISTTIAGLLLLLAAMFLV